MAMMIAAAAVTVKARLATRENKSQVFAHQGDGGHCQCAAGDEREEHVRQVVGSVERIQQLYRVAVLA